MVKEKNIENKKQEYLVVEDLYNKRGEIIYAKNGIYTEDEEGNTISSDEMKHRFPFVPIKTISEDGETYYSNTESIPNPFQDISNIRAAKEPYPKDEYGGLFKFEFSWMVTPSSGGSSYLNSETVIKAFNSGHDCAEYIESYIAKISRNPSVKNVKVAKIERI